MSASPDLQAPPGVVELREDVPLKARGAGGAGGAGGARLCAGGPRLIAAAFAVLSAAVTLALLTQIYYGDYEVVPHGSVSSSAAACSRAGTAALRAGGRALDAAAAAALCLAVLAPHRTSLDASGSLVYWEYRSLRTQAPTVAEWGGGEEPAAPPAGRAPRLLAALAALHGRLGQLPWPQVLQPAIDLAREGFPVSETLAQEAARRGVPGYSPAALRRDPALADYLETLQRNTTAELCAAWQCAGAVRWRAAPAPVAVGAWRAWAAGAGGALAAAALHDAFDRDAALLTPAGALEGVIDSLQRRWLAGGVGAGAGSVGDAGGVSSGLAVVDARDTYAALVTGLSMPFGSEAPAAEGSGGAWRADSPTGPLDLAPAIIVDGDVCGTRYVMGAESGAALAEGAAGALAAGGAGGAGAVDAVEAARVLRGAGGAAAREPGRAAALPALAALPLLNGSRPLPALNFVQQRGDALLSHADSRGGGLASRF